jgi:hypothetical protein
VSTSKPLENFHTVRPDLVEVPATANARDAMEAAALQRLYEVLDPRMRDEMRSFLESPDFNEQPSVNRIRNAEAARMLAQIYAIRQARRDDARLLDLGIRLPLPFRS